MTSISNYSNRGFLELPSANTKAALCKTAVKILTKSLSVASVTAAAMAILTMVFPPAGALAIPIVLGAFATSLIVNTIIAIYNHTHPPKPPTLQPASSPLPLPSARVTIAVGPISRSPEPEVNENEGDLNAYLDPQEADLEEQNLEVEPKEDEIPLEESNAALSIPYSSGAENFITLLTKITDRLAESDQKLVGLRDFEKLKELALKKGKLFLVLNDEMKTLSELEKATIELYQESEEHADVAPWITNILLAIEETKHEYTKQILYSKSTEQRLGIGKTEQLPPVKPIVPMAPLPLSRL